MAKTRSQIKTAVDNNTGRGTEKATLIETLCDEALKVALTEHPFRDARSTPSDITLTEDATYVAHGVSALVNVVTARIVDADGSQNTPLIMKLPTWWDKNVVNAEDNLKGRPSYGIREGANIHFERPLESGLELRLRVTTEQTFTSDSTACPIAVLDIFVVQYVTAYVFASIQDMDKFNFWIRRALGWKWDDGVVGGTLRHCIDNDSKDISEEIEASGSQQPRLQGTSIQNLITGHDDYGNVRTWF